MAQLSDLTLWAQQRADRVNAPTITSSEWTQMVNASVQELYGVLTSTYEDYNITQVQFTLAGGAPPGNTLTVGPNGTVTDFFLPRFVWRQVAQSGSSPVWATVTRLRSMMERNLHAGVLVNPIYGQVAAYWNLFGTNLELLPPESSAGTYMLGYVPVMPQLVNPTDTVDPYWLTVNGWQEYVVLDVAAKALVKEESLDTAQFLLGQKETLRQRILREAKPRDDSEPGQITDVQRVRDNWGFGPGPGWNPFGW